MTAVKVVAGNGCPRGRFPRRLFFREIKHAAKRGFLASAAVAARFVKAFRVFPEYGGLRHTAITRNRRSRSRSAEPGCRLTAADTGLPVPVKRQGCARTSRVPADILYSLKGGCPARLGLLRSRNPARNAHKHRTLHVETKATPLNLVG